MKKLTSLAIACIFVLSCLTSCSEADSSNTATSTTTTTVVTTTTTTTVSDSVPESTTTESMKETTTTTEPSTTESETTTTTEPTTTTTTTKVTTKATTKETTTTKKAPEPTGNRVVLDVKNIQMLPELPSGCEITCASMVLNYFGFNVSKMDLIKYLTIDEAPDADGTWGDPYYVFVGHPTKSGYGCYDNALKECIDNYFNSTNVNNYQVLDTVSGINAFKKEIKNGNPVILWVTNPMEAMTRVGKTWMTSDGEEIDWLEPEHCVVMIGYDQDKNTIIISDPNNAKGTLEYPMNVVEDANMKMFGMALVIRKK